MMLYSYDDSVLGLRWQTVHLVAINTATKWTVCHLNPSTLSSYEYSIIFRSSEENANADAMSRLPVRECVSDAPNPAETVLLLEHLESSQCQSNSESDSQRPIAVKGLPICHGRMDSSG